jgi:Putative lumazine-binding
MRFEAPNIQRLFRLSKKYLVSLSQFSNLSGWKRSHSYLGKLLFVSNMKKPFFLPKIYLVVLLAVFFGNAAFAQKNDLTSEEKAVMTPIAQLFDGMRIGDSSLVRDAFLPNAQMQTVLMKDGQPSLRSETVDRFVKTVGTPHDKVWDEQLFEQGIKIDGSLAVVWTDYRFYLGGEFSHCGVNVFQLIKTDRGWKIFQICDTRRKDDCEPEKGKKKGGK